MYFTYQMLKIFKNKKKFSSFFIFVYALFIIIFTLHYHKYDLNEKQEIKNQQEENAALILDFLSDGLSVCAINHFSHSILNFSTTSQDFKIFFHRIDISSYKTNLFHIRTNLLNNISPRASPLFS
jgi:hypothetical protein